jgi:hypothetical protein
VRDAKNEHREPLRCIGYDQGTAELTHRPELRGVVQKMSDQFDETTWGEFLLRYDDRGSAIGQQACVGCLLVSARTRKRDEKSRFAERCDFGDRARTCSSDHQVCCRVDVGEFVIEALSNDVAPLEILRKLGAGLLQAW